MPMCSSRVLFGLESSGRALSRNWLSHANVFELSPVGGCKYERYVRCISTNEQRQPAKHHVAKITGSAWELLDFN